jgi:hypothetical protein
MHPNTYKIRLLFRHDTLDFTEVRDALSAIPGIHIGRLMNFGQDRYTPTGRRLPGQYRDSRFGFDFWSGKEWAKSEVKDSSQAVEDILRKLQPHKQRLAALAAKGCELSIIVAVSVEANTSTHVSPDLAAKLAGMHMTLWYDLYPPDKASE